MKKLMNTLYILSDDVYIKQDGENIVVMRGTEVLGRYPFHIFDNVVSFSYKGASPALMGACVKRSIGISFYSPNGKFLARATGMSCGNILLRKEQFRIAETKEARMEYARNIILGKAFNCRWVLERTVRDNGMRVDADSIKKVSEEIQQRIKEIQGCSELDSLRGKEGEIASRYFSVFDHMIINQKDDFSFKQRNRRPPRDNINALLSFMYTILTNECGNALEGVGLDAYSGFLHTDRPGRKSLALDLVEEFRGAIADRFVLTLVNKRIINKTHFIDQGNSIYLNSEGREKFFKAWQQKKKEIITHPFLNEKVPWGLVPHIQAMLMARTVRGDLESYPPFLWK